MNNLLLEIIELRATIERHYKTLSRDEYIWMNDLIEQYKMDIEGAQQRLEFDNRYSREALGNPSIIQDPFLN